ncbi:hypothetical protein [Nitrosomonas sp. Nm166]|uniref:hypothetical protein n=1 Tax=Nitrosomonas sp. Nm166 TaxID=1881054 RepID=UPI0008E9E164|nr:hypothetical protein [Nitrosomonas sp. Nm166]SFD91873.1 hypothetical protein SAMN05428977_1002106 [Nitrosomonas sp. Nm166]
MNKELSFDDENGIYPAADENNEDGTLMNSKIPIGRFAGFIDEFETFSDFDDGEEDDDVDFDSQGLF